MTTAGRADPEDLALQVRQGSGTAAGRSAVSRAITLMESTRTDHRDAAKALYALLVPHAGRAIRLGISGAPGAGKSTLIETLGGLLTSAGHRVGVLAVDPSSSRTGGSVMGDKTRMPELAANRNAYVRPSPTSGTLGGVARATPQSIIVLEAAGFDVVVVETVGVGQSETTVAAMVDTFVLLSLSRTGDQLQGLKKGVLELADIIAVNKADGDRLDEARSTARDLTAAVRLVRGRNGWVPPVLTCSGLTGAGVEQLWQAVLRHREFLGEDGLHQKRSGQQVDLMWALVKDELAERLRRSPGVRDAQKSISESVAAGIVSPTAAADELLLAYDTTGSETDQA